MSRRPRVPGMAGPAKVYRLEVATGGKPIRAYVRAMRALPVGAGQVWMTDLLHDEECPALESRQVADCRCEILKVRARRAA